MSATTSPTFKKKIAALEAAGDLETLKSLHTDATIKEEVARMRFAKNRSVKNGETYRRLGAAKGEIKRAIYSLDIKKAKTDTSEVAETEEKPLDEAGAIGAAVGNVMRTARDRALYHGAGSQQARGRLDLGAITQKMLQNWGRYVGHSAATGDKHLKNAPTWGDLIEFLNFAYGIKVDTGVIAQLTKRAASVNAPKAAKPVAPAAAPTAPQHSEKDLQGMLTKQVADWDNANTRKQRADDLAKGALSKTSPEEYAALKNKFGKVPNYPGKKVGESVITELDDTEQHPDAPEDNSPDAEEEEHDPAQTVFDPRSLFPILADFLLKKGLVKVKRGNETYGAKGDPDEDEADGEETETARETPDGHTVNIDKMNKYLAQYKVSAKDLNDLKKLIKAKPAEAYKLISDDKRAPRTLSVLVFSVLRSIVGKDDVDHDKASRSITSEGNMFDIGRFMGELKKRKILGGDLKSLLAELKTEGAQNVMNAFKGTNSRQSQVIYNVAASALNSIVKEQKKATPAAAPTEEAPKEEQ